MDFTDKDLRTLVKRAETKVARQQEALDISQTELRFYRELLDRKTVKK